MDNKRYNVASPRDYEDRNGEKRTSWVNLGVAFEKDGKITVLLNAAPFPGPDGQAKLILMEPREDDDRGNGGSTRNGNGNGHGGGYERDRGRDDRDAGRSSNGSRW